MSSISSSWRARYNRLGQTLIVLLLVFSLVPSFALAVELPPPGNPNYIQTNAPATQLGRGDWYTSNAAGAGAGYGYLTIEVPCGWPAAKPIDIDLYSPEMNSTTNLSDENDSGIRADTTFELYAPGTAFSSPATPGPGAAGSIVAANYATSAAVQQWVRFYTINVGTTGCGRYLLRSQSWDDDQNGWRIRVGDDEDADPNDAVPASGYDDADGASGTGDELSVGLLQTSFQHDAGAVACLDLYEYVAPSQPSVTFHNFDMDGNQSVRYYAPGSSTATVGVVSGSSLWNGSTNTTRVGDTIANPASGWWRLEACVNDHNQYIQEGQTAQPVYYQQPPAPVMAISKTDGVSEVEVDDTLTYSNVFTNTSNTTSTPGAAANLVLQDVIPDDTTYVSCNANGLGTCSYNGATRTVTFTLTTIVGAGQSATVFTSVQVANTATEGESLTSTVTFGYQDVYGRSYTPVDEADVDLVVPPLAVQIAAFTATPMKNGILLAWETVAEIDNQGFNLRRSTESGVLGEVINQSLIASQGPDSSQGFSYEWIDTSVQAGVTYYYWLEAVDEAGQTSLFGPTSAIYNLPTAVTLTSLGQTPSALAWPLALTVVMLGAGLVTLVAVQRRHRKR